MRKFTKLLFIGLFACLTLLTVAFAVGCQPDEPEKQLTFKEPKSGKGTASYLSEIIPGDLRSMRLDTGDSADFSPYEVEEGSYKVKFTSASQKIYYRFKAPKVAVYQVYSSTLEDAVDPTITLFHGDQNYTGYINPKLISDGDDDDSGYYSDNKSDTDKNFYLEITCLDGNLMQDDGRFLFELNLADPAGVNKEFAITFEYKGEYVPPKEPEKIIKEATQIKEFTLPNGTWVDAPLGIDETFDPVYNPEDGYYHRNFSEGEIIYAVMGRAPLTEDDDPITPRGLDLGFKQQYENANSFVEFDGTYEIYWDQLMLAYADNCMESYGRHPVTPELKDFLDYYINKRAGVKEPIEETLGERLPTGKEWIWACGYYQATEDFPYTLALGENTISIELNYEKNLIPFWADFYTPQGEGNYVITTESKNLKMAWYGESLDSEPTEITFTEDDSSYTFVGEPQSRYIMCFTTINGAAEELSVSVTFEDSSEPNGTWNHPYVLNGEDIVGTHSENITDKDVSIYYIFTPDADISLKLTFGEGTRLTIDYQEEDASIQISSEDGRNFVDGAYTMLFKQGTTYRFAISVSTTEGVASFTAERA